MLLELPGRNPSRTYLLPFLRGTLGTMYRQVSLLYALITSPQYALPFLSAPVAESVEFSIKHSSIFRLLLCPHNPLLSPNILVLVID
jgi:hypothetical protein